MHKEWLKKNPQKRPKESVIRKQVSHYYQGGTLCEKTQKHREVEVKLKCLENSQSMSTVSIYLLEPQTCKYVLGVESPFICDFLQKTDNDGLLPKSSSDNGIKQSQKVEGQFVGNAIVEDIEVRFEND